MRLPLDNFSKALHANRHEKRWSFAGIMTIEMSVRREIILFHTCKIFLPKCMGCHNSWTAFKIKTLSSSFLHSCLGQDEPLWKPDTLLTGKGLGPKNSKANTKSIEPGILRQICLNFPRGAETEFFSQGNYPWRKKFCLCTEGTARWPFFNHSLRNAIGGFWKNKVFDIVIFQNKNSNNFFYEQQKHFFGSVWVELPF